ncbi:MAG: DUF2992 family protein [Clostridia bacterium]|nr:DUF2992 family protein [Clostridia bacterium]
MEADAISLTVFFQEPFWIGVFERVEDGGSRYPTSLREESKNPAVRARIAGFLRWGHASASTVMTAASGAFLPMEAMPFLALALAL